MICASEHEIVHKQFAPKTPTYRLDINSSNRRIIRTVFEHDFVDKRKYPPASPDICWLIFEVAGGVVESCCSNEKCWFEGGKFGYNQSQEMRPRCMILSWRFKFYSVLLNFLYICSFVECSAFYLGKGKVDHIIPWQEMVVVLSNVLLFIWVKARLIISYHGRRSLQDHQIF